MGKSTIKLIALFDLILKEDPNYEEVFKNKKLKIIDKRTGEEVKDAHVDAGEIFEVDRDFGKELMKKRLAVYPSRYISTGKRIRIITSEQEEILKSLTEELEETGKSEIVN